VTYERTGQKGSRADTFLHDAMLKKTNKTTPTNTWGAAVRGWQLTDGKGCKALVSLARVLKND